MRAPLLLVLPATLGLAAAVHAGFVSAVPRLRNAHLVETLAPGGANLARPIAGAAAPGLAETMCLWDVADGPVIVEAPVPGAFWSLAAYGPDGRAFLSLDETEGGRAGLVRLVLAEADGPAAVRARSKAGPGARLVLVPATRGVLVVRALAESEAGRPAIAETQRRTFCLPAS